MRLTMPCGCFPPPPPPCGCMPPPLPGPWQYTPSFLYPRFHYVCNWQHFIPPFPVFVPNQPTPRCCCLPPHYVDPRIWW